MDVLDLVRTRQMRENRMRPQRHVELVDRLESKNGQVKTGQGGCRQKDSFCVAKQVEREVQRLARSSAQEMFNLELLAAGGKLSARASVLSRQQYAQLL